VAVLHAVERELERAIARVEELNAERAAAEARVRLVDAERRAAKATVESLLAIIAEVGGGEVSADAQPEQTDLDILSGAKLREMAARVALERDAIGREVHYLDWFAWLKDAGYTAGGKRPEATFLTQLGRSPIIQSGAGTGSYVLDLQPIEALESELRKLDEELGQLPPPTQMSMAGDERERRVHLRARIERVERVLDEVWQVLATVAPPGHSGPVETLRDALRAWADYIARRDQLILTPGRAQTN
jgi:hypothetical protein